MLYRRPTVPEGHMLSFAFSLSFSHISLSAMYSASDRSSWACMSGAFWSSWTTSIQTLGSSGMLDSFSLSDRQSV